VVLTSERSRVWSLEQESNYHPKLDGACYSEYLGESWGRKKDVVSSKIETSDGSTWSHNLTLKMPCPFLPLVFMEVKMFFLSCTDDLEEILMGQWLSKSDHEEGQFLKYVGFLESSTMPAFGDRT